MYTYRSLGEKYRLHMLAIAPYRNFNTTLRLFLVLHSFFHFSITSYIPFIVFLLCYGWYWYPFHFRVSPSFFPISFFLSILYPIFSRYHGDYTILLFLNPFYPTLPFTRYSIHSRYPSISLLINFYIYTSFPIIITISPSFHPYLFITYSFPFYLLYNIYNGCCSI